MALSMVPLDRQSESVGGPCPLSIHVIHHHETAFIGVADMSALTELIAWLQVHVWRCSGKWLPAGA